MFVTLLLGRKLVLDSKQFDNLLLDLFPLNRSITGDGNRKTLEILKGIVPALQIKEVKSGTKAFDWVIPKEWKVNHAYLLDERKNKIIDYTDNNLHLIGYSASFSGKLSRDELKPHLYTSDVLPDAIPYVTSYYDSNWGFCVTKEFKDNLKDEIYEVEIDTEHFKGSMTYGEVFIKGNSKKEILFSTYICHPSMASNEISGPLVAINLAMDLYNSKKNEFSYRFLFLPETIGSIFYLSKNLKKMKKNVIAGFVLTCLGDNRNWSFLTSKYNNTYSDKLAEFILQDNKIRFKKYDFLNRGSDERQYCYPFVNLPIVSIMRSKYGEFKEYHTSFDNLDFVNGANLVESSALYFEIIKVIETNYFPRATTLCEPMMSKRNLRKGNSNIKLDDFDQNVMNFLIYSDGQNDLIDLATRLNISYQSCLEISDLLKDNGLVR